MLTHPPTHAYLFWWLKDQECEFTLEISTHPKGCALQLLTDETEIEIKSYPSDGHG